MANRDRALLRVEEAAEMLGISRARAYELAASGALPSVRIGRSRRVPVRQLEEWIEERWQEAEAARHPSSNATSRDD
ncbi:MAG: helix-turn-helix domain-containing protein [Chloroflexi bacterium]|nr:helix-turn-helix domain-containing protein [Chloroflexota bacterium]